MMLVVCKKIFNKSNASKRQRVKKAQLQEFAKKRRYLAKDMITSGWGVLY